MTTLRRLPLSYCLPYSGVYSPDHRIKFPGDVIRRPKGHGSCGESGGIRSRILEIGVVSKIIAYLRSAISDENLCDNPRGWVYISHSAALL